jgi:hypothetical protein
VRASAVSEHTTTRRPRALLDGDLQKPRLSAGIMIPCSV